MGVHFHSPNGCWDRLQVENLPSGAISQIFGEMDERPDAALTPPYILIKP